MRTYLPHNVSFRLRPYFAGKKTLSTLESPRRASREAGPAASVCLHALPAPLQGRTPSEGRDCVCLSPALPRPPPSPQPRFHRAVKPGRAAHVPAHAWRRDERQTKQAPACPRGTCSLRGDGGATESHGHTCDGSMWHTWQSPPSRLGPGSVPGRGRRDCAVTLRRSRSQVVPGGAGPHEG